MSMDVDDLERSGHYVDPEDVHVGDLIWADGGPHYVEWRLETGVITCCGRFVPWAEIGHCWPDPLAQPHRKPTERHAQNVHDL